MAVGEASIHIARPPDEVFAFVDDAANNPLWRKNVIRTEWIDGGPMRVGRRGRQTRLATPRMISQALLDLETLRRRLESA